MTLYLTPVADKGPFDVAKRFSELYTNTAYFYHDDILHSSKQSYVTNSLPNPVVSKSKNMRFLLVCDDSGIAGISTMSASSSMSMLVWYVSPVNVKYECTFDSFNNMAF